MRIEAKKLGMEDCNKSKAFLIWPRKRFHPPDRKYLNNALF